MYPSKSLIADPPASTPSLLGLQVLSALITFEILVFRKGKQLSILQADKGYVSGNLVFCWKETFILL